MPLRCLLPQVASSTNKCISEKGECEKQVSNKRSVPNQEVLEASCCLYQWPSTTITTSTCLQNLEEKILFAGENSTVTITGTKRSLHTKSRQGMRASAHSNYAKRQMTGL